MIREIFLLNVRIAAWALNYSQIAIWLMNEILISKELSGAMRAFFYFIVANLRVKFEVFLRDAFIAIFDWTFDKSIRTVMSQNCFIGQF